MKSNFKKRVYNYLLLNLLLLSQLLQAQPGFGDAGDNVQDVPAASIDNVAILIFLVGVIGSFLLLRKRKQQSKL